MIDRAQDLAESLSNGLSRRNFLGGIGRGAALIALACGGLLAVPHEARAGRPCSTERPCPTNHICGTDGRCHPQPPKKH